MHGSSLTSSPQLRGRPFALRRSNAVRYAPTKDFVYLSPTVLTQSHIEDVAVPEFQNQNSRLQQGPVVQNFNSTTHHSRKPRVMARYYEKALSTEDRVALARGEKNHNLKSWTPKEMVIYGDTRQDFTTSNTCVGYNKQEFWMPVITVTEGRTIRTHIEQLRHQLNALRVSRVPYAQPVMPRSIARGPISNELSC